MLNLPFAFATEIDSTKHEFVPYFTEFGLSDEFHAFTWLRAVLVHFLPLVLLTFCNIYLLYEVMLPYTLKYMYTRPVRCKFY